MTPEEMLASLGKFTSKYGDLLGGIGGAVANERYIGDIRDTQTGLMQFC